MSFSRVQQHFRGLAMVSSVQEDPAQQFQVDQSQQVIRVIALLCHVFVDHLANNRPVEKSALRNLIFGQ